jgi:oxygen-independent coproporphyrinogen-3 oxidase
LNDRAAGLYLHVPFCARICPYCDFAVRTGDAARRRRFVDHLLQEIEMHAGYPLTFDTIYFGGGTPSSLDADDLGRALDTLRSRLTIGGPVRIFLEANPEDVTAGSAAVWRGLGIDTLSLGVQSLDAAALGFLGRTHTVDTARRAVGAALDAGFDTVSLDLIYGLPGQSASAWQDDLDRAVELGPHHLSCYQLTIHERTRFALLEKRGRLHPLPDDEQGSLFRLTHRHLDDAGFRGYEVSNFASSPEHRSLHNLKYWDHTPYLGFGPSAHSFHGDRRWWNLRKTDPWQEAVASGRKPIGESETLGASDLLLESLMLGFRTYAGVDLKSLGAERGIDLFAANAALIERLEADELISIEDGWLVPTLRGLSVADSLARGFELAR